MYEAVEVFVNIFQAFAITFYLIKCLGVKEGKNRKCAYITGVIVTVLYLEIMNRIIFFESVGVLIYLVVSLAFSAVFLCGNVVQKIMYNVVMMVAIVCAAMLGAGIVGVIKGTDFLKVGQYGESSRYISLVLTQVILCIFFYMIIKFKTMNEHMDNRYMMVLSIVPVVSVIICCLIVYQENKSESIRALYTLIAVVGIITVNIINMVLMSIERKVYEHNTEDTLSFNIGNSVMNGIKEINTDTQTTKEDSRKHGYGLKNIKDVVDKYNGEISYEMRRPDYIMCRVELSLGK